ncbi:MAG TPA: hypothetical protein V6D07_06080 [Trichocoleus sp.]
MVNLQTNSRLSWMRSLFKDHTHQPTLVVCRMFICIGQTPLNISQNGNELASPVPTGLLETIQGIPPLFERLVAPEAQQQSQP